MQPWMDNMKNSALWKKYLKTYHTFNYVCQEVAAGNSRMFFEASQLEFLGEVIRMYTYEYVMLRKLKITGNPVVYDRAQEPIAMVMAPAALHDF